MDDAFAEEDDRMSEVDVGFMEGVEESEEDDVPFRFPGVATLRGAFASLDDVNLVEEFEERACVMNSVPRFMNGLYRIAMQPLEEMNTTDEVRVERGWKLFLLLPRMLLHRASQGGLMNRLELFNRGLGESCWRPVWPPSRSVEAQKKPETGTGHSAPSHPCTWESCHQSDKLWKARRWRQDRSEEDGDNS